MEPGLACSFGIDCRPVCRPGRTCMLPGACEGFLLAYSVFSVIIEVLMGLLLVHVRRSASPRAFLPKCFEELSEE